MLAQFKKPLTRASGTVLFREGEASSSCFVMGSGSVRLSITAAAGKRVAVRTAESGEILGLGETLSGQVYDVTAETLETCSIVEFNRDELLQLMHKNQPLCDWVLARLCKDLDMAYNAMRSLAAKRTRRRQGASATPGIAAGKAHRR